MTSTFKYEPSYVAGGELDISVDDFLIPAADFSLPIPVHRNYLQLDTGRSAIYIALSTIIKQGGKKEAWLPRYSCPSVALPFMKLGFKLNFYATGNDLNSPSGLPEKLDRETFLFIHYFGKRNQAVQNYLEAMKQHYTFFIIEDCVQALLSSNLGTFDFAVYSYRKFLPLPDGALLSSGCPLEESDLAPADESFVSRRLIGKLIRSRNKSEFFLDLFADAEETIDNFLVPRKISYLSSYLLARTNATEIARKRRTNFFYLLESIKQCSFDYELLHTLFDSLEPGEVPLGLPVVVNPACRDRLRKFLATQKIYCPVHWPLEIEGAVLWRNEVKLSRSLLTLPLDQRVNCSILNELLDRLSCFLLGKGVRN